MFVYFGENAAPSRFVGHQGRFPAETCSIQVFPRHSRTPLLFRSISRTEGRQIKLLYVLSAATSPNYRDIKPKPSAINYKSFCDEAWGKRMRGPSTDKAIPTRNMNPSASGRSDIFYGNVGLAGSPILININEIWMFLNKTAWINKFLFFCASILTLSVFE
ncbi:hypothetical protein GWI33_007088 [Rhynchophorus ferrugineus]|uniref:Uncharacterized protein n=1 Tax=Rhynchophorus ferrugineus TaxID=354439 RepID=A0A834MCD2_RHYFE|nr:hypothetical protein GWI33_007088 [Rhynchophorus ferrugineus]